MKDHLLDILSHTLDLGFITLIKVVGTGEKTTIFSVTDDKTVVTQGEFHTPLNDFAGTFGMPNLNKLKIILNLQEYQDNPNITVTTKASTNELDGIEFKNSMGDFKNDYRFMDANTINSRVPTPRFRGANWNIEFTPSVASIQRLRMQSQANAEETVFQCKTENGQLKFFFGDHSTHAGNFVFQPNVSGVLSQPWSWPITQVLSILSTSGDKIMRISDNGAIQITVDSGLVKYDYIITAQSK